MFPYKYIAIEGNIGAGKSTLAKFLSQHLNGKKLMEEFEENESLKDFYSNAKFALQAELQFLLDRNRQLHYFHQKEHDLIISDYIPNKSLLFAKLNLSSANYSLYEPIALKMLSEFPQPDLVIYLKRSTEELLNNIKNRGRNYEEQIPAGYLESLNEVYQSDLTKRVDCPILEIEANEINLNRSKDLAAAFTRILRTEYAPQVRQINLRSILDFEKVRVQ